MQPTIKLLHSPDPVLGVRKEPVKPEICILVRINVNKADADCNPFGIQTTECRSRWALAFSACPSGFELPHKSQSVAS